MIRRCWTLCSLSKRQPSDRGVAVFGVVERWNHVRGHGKVRVEESTSGPLQAPIAAIISRSDLCGGHFLVEGQQVRALMHAPPGKGARVSRATNRDGSPIRPRSIRGRITNWNALLQTGIITELDFEGNLNNDAPKFPFDGADYECATPPIGLGLEVCFCVGGKPRRAKRVVLRYSAAPPIPSRGRIRTILDTHGFLNDAVTGESIYFHLNSLIDGDIGPGDLVSYKCVEEPPVSFSAGKKLAIAITRSTDAT